MKMDRQIDAYDAFTAWLKRAQEIRIMFQNLGEPVPEPLQRFLSGGSAAPMPRSPLVISGPPTPTRPQVAKDDWIALRSAGVSTKVLLLALLRARHPATMRSQDVISQMLVLKEKQSQGSIYNAGAALETVDHLITRDGGEWAYSGKGMTDPILHHDETTDAHFVWGPIDAFTVQDQAAHRREGIRHLLRAYASAGGLMATQLVALLNDADWMQVPATKDFIKLDVETMERDGEIKQSGNSRKWILR